MIHLFLNENHVNRVDPGTNTRNFENQRTVITYLLTYTME